MPSKFQDFWVTGSRMFFEREADADGTKYPVIDLGIVDVISPSITPEEITLKDSDGGIKRIADQRTVGIEEVYEVKCSNLNPENLALLFLSNAAADPEQAQISIDATQRAFPGKLLKLKDDDGINVFGIDVVSGVYTGTVLTYVLTTITKSSKTLKITGDHHTDAGLQAGKKIIVKSTGLTEVLNAKTYTVASVAFSVTTNIVVVETPEADESAVTGVLLCEDGGDIYSEGDDWEVAGEINRGFIRIIEDGDIDTEQDIQAVFTSAALDGARLLNPQSLSGQIKGQAILFWGRLGNAEQSAREFSVSVTPGSAAFAVDDYSNFTLKFTVLADLGAEVPAGRLLYFKGELPDLS